MALAGATGVSGGSAHTVPALLLPKEIGGRRLTDLTDLTRLDDGDLGGTACYRVRGRYPGDPAAEEAIRREFTRVTGQPYGDPEDGPTVLWIEKGTLLLRRIEEGCRHGTTRWEMVTTYDPEVNVPIPDDHLEFDPPDTDDA